jgi:hypothetical protein
MQGLISWLDLDIQGNSQDLAVARFHAKAISETIEYLATWAQSKRPLTRSQAAWVAEQLLRSQKAFKLARGSLYSRVSLTFQVIWEAAKILVSGDRRKA